MISKTRLRPIVAASLLAAPLLVQAQPEPPNTPLTGVVLALSFLFVLGIIAIALLGPQWMLRNLMRERSELIDKLLAAGQPVPPELLVPPTPPSPPSKPPLSAHQRQRRGVGLLALGVGIAAVAYFGFDSLRMASWGLLFLALSIASFVNARYFSDERPAD